MVEAKTMRATPASRQASATRRVPPTLTSRRPATPSLAVPASQPAKAASDTLSVADVGQLSSDEQLLFTALQGIVNRDSPHIYLLGIKDGQDFTTDATAALWLRDAVPLTSQQVADP